MAEHLGAFDASQIGSGGQNSASPKTGASMLVPHDDPGIAADVIQAKAQAKATIHEASAKDFAPPIEELDPEELDPEELDGQDQSIGPHKQGGKALSLDEYTKTLESLSARDRRLAIAAGVGVAAGLVVAAVGSVKTALIAAAVAAAMGGATWGGLELVDYKRKAKRKEKRESS